MSDVDVSGRFERETEAQTLTQGGSVGAQREEAQATAATQGQEETSQGLLVVALVVVTLVVVVVVVFQLLTIIESRLRR
jgi:hypothetical protein